MAIPDFQTVMLPLLVHLRDGQDHANQETLKVLAEQFHLTEEERADIAPPTFSPATP
jgi:restriction system protein